MIQTVYKLFRWRLNGTLGPLFINRKQVLPVGEWLDAEDHPTKGYAHRPGWHVTDKPIAPHLSKIGRRWMKVEIEDFYEIPRPVSQGAKWFIAKRMRIVSDLTEEEWQLSLKK